MLQAAKISKQNDLVVTVIYKEAIFVNHFFLYVILELRIAVI